MLERLAGEILWVGFKGRTLPDELATRLGKGHAGHVILFSRNLGNLDEVAALTDACHRAATDRHVLVAVDQEGGRVQRVREPATRWPPMMTLAGRSGELARDVGRALGKELAALGFDVDFAPVLDVHTNPANPVIGDRALGTDPEAVSATGRELAAGLLEAGVLPCGKHFPGHGDTHLDSHLELPRIDHDLERLRDVELVPFRGNLQLPMLMTAHVVFAALDDEVPATLSKKVITGLLREDMGYDGMIVSDDMEMKAIADNYGAEDAVERALMAGCDAFLLCHEAELQVRVHEHLIRRAQSSSEVRARLEEAATRVRRLAASHQPVRPAPQVIGCQAHQALARRLTAAG